MRKLVKLLIFFTIAVLPISLINYPFNNVNLNFNKSKPNHQIDLKTSGSWSLPPLFINGSANGVGAHNWSWVESQIWFGGGNGTWVNPYIIENITISGSSSNTCFEIVDSNQFFILRNCVLLYSGPQPNYAGLKMVNVNNSKILKNTIGPNIGYGLYFNSCNNITFAENDVENNGIGMQVVYSKIIRFINNSFSFNAGSGAFFGNAYNISIIHNTIIGNDQDGLKLIEFYEGNILNNTIDYNNGDGIYLNGNNNEVINNSANYNLNDGIGFYNSLSNTIINNRMAHNYVAGLFLSNADLNIVIGNKINYNFYGLRIWLSDNNSIQDNNLIRNQECILEANCVVNVFINNICYELKKIFIEIVNQAYSSDKFNFTFYFYAENNTGIIIDTIQIFWNSSDFSSSVQNIGTGIYFISLPPITVVPGEDPIILSITVIADGYEEKYFEMYLAVDPETLNKEHTSPVSIPGYDYILLLAALVLSALIIIKKKLKFNE